MKHSKVLLTLSTLSVLLLVSGCAHTSCPRSTNAKQSQKTNNRLNCSPVVQNPARFPNHERPYVMAGQPRPVNGRLPTEVKF